MIDEGWRRNKYGGLFNINEDRYVGGKKVSVKKGQTLSDAMKESGKFKKKETEIKNEKSLKEEWNAKNEDKISNMNSSQMIEEIRDQLKDSGIGDSFAINGKTQGFFEKRSALGTVVEVTSTTNSKFNAKITKVKIFEDKAKTPHEKEVIDSLKKKFKDYL